MDLDFDKYKAQQFCDNLDCPYHGRTGLKNIRTHSRLHHQVYCNACKQIWVITKGTFFYRLKAPVSLILKCCSNFGAILIIDNKTIGCELKEAEKPEIAGPGS